MCHPAKLRGLKPKLNGGIIKKGARIGAGAKILPDLIIGEESVIGAGSVVTKNIPPYTVVYKIPAQQIKKVNKKELLKI